MPGDGSAHGLSIEKVETAGPFQTVDKDVRKGFLRIVAKSNVRFQKPDVFIEGPELAFFSAGLGRAEVDHVVEIQRIVVRRGVGGDRFPGFVDEHGAILFMVVLSIVALNFLDAWYTIYFLSFGGSELNPMVNWLLGMGTWPFILAKSLGIGLCVAMLTLTKNFKIARVGLGMGFDSPYRYQPLKLNLSTS